MLLSVKTKTAFSLVAICCFALVSACSNLFFQPMREHVLTPKQLGLDYEDVAIDSAGAQLHGWLLLAQGDPRGSVLFFHGNAENISTHIAAVHWLPRSGYNVLLIDYRGYGRSTGTPSIPGAIEDIESAMRHASQDERLSARGWVVFGQSLGGALALHASAHSSYRKHIRAVVVESVFSDFREIAREKLGEFLLTWPLQYPLSWLFTGDYSPVDAIARISPTPVLIIHGDRDEVVPYHHGTHLFSAAGEPRELWVVENGRHIEAMTRAEYRNRLAKYLDKVFVNTR